MVRRWRSVRNYPTVHQFISPSWAKLMLIRRQEVVCGPMPFGTLHRIHRHLPIIDNRKCIPDQPTIRQNVVGSPTAPVDSGAEWNDPDDAPELTEAMLDDAEWFHGNTFIRRGRGRPKSDAAKEQISVRLDPDVLAKLRAAGPGWQSQINTLLRQALGLAKDIHG
jgi:uncharacterized protein (DUF4415 family)